jgi:membrane-bound ClpP family serine protease
MMMKKKLTSTRLCLAVASIAAQLAAIWVVWRWLLPVWNLRPAVWVLVVALFAWLLFSIFLYVSGSSALKIKEYAGLSTMIGMEGEAISRLAPDGEVKIKGELWNAATEDGIIEVGEKIIVSSEDRLKLVVKRQNQTRNGQ